MRTENEVIAMLEFVQENRKKLLSVADNFERIDCDMEIEIDVLKWVLKIK